MPGETRGCLDDTRGCLDDSRSPSGNNRPAVGVESGRRRQTGSLRSRPHGVERIGGQLGRGRDARVAHHGAVRGGEALAQRAVPLASSRAGSGDLAGDLTGVVEEARESSLAASLEREVSHDHGRHAPERVRHGEDPVLAVHAVRGFIARRRRRPLSG